MAKKAMIAKANRKAKFSTQQYNRCRICGRPRGYMREFAVCRICFRNLAGYGEITGVTKASW